MLYKVRGFVNVRILKLIYHAILDYYLNHAKQYEVKTKKSLTQVFILQKKALRTISFVRRNAHSNPHLYMHEIIQSSDKIITENCIFLEVNLLILIFHRFAIIGLPFPQIIIGMKHLVLQKNS